MNNKVIITAALTGAMTPKELNENIPLTPEEIAADAYKCWKAGDLFRCQRNIFI